LKQIKNYMKMKRKILVVDDSYYMRTMLKNLLADAGHDIIGEAANGEEALKLAKTLLPDMVTLDVILPDTTGLEVLKEIKKDLPHLKVVIVSAVGQELVVNEAIQNGAIAYIVKPFNEEKVVEVVENVFK
jgi:two-component system, chemotaxis family, chemotaxis protein CheY